LNLQQLFELEWGIEVLPEEVIEIGLDELHLVLRANQDLPSVGEFDLGLEEIILWDRSPVVKRLRLCGLGLQGPDLLGGEFRRFLGAEHGDVGAHHFERQRMLRGPQAAA
jgi:hypothetical protein